MNPTTVAVIGAPGAGKSTVGGLLARRLGVPHIDVDAQIEAAEGRPIREIFASDGEDYFRALERDAGIALKDLATMARNSIEASFVDEDERRRMLAMHDSWLRLRLHDDDEGKAKVAGMKGTDAEGTNTGA